MDIDADKVIQKLADRVREVELDNAVLRAVIETMEAKQEPQQAANPALRPVPDRPAAKDNVNPPEPPQDNVT